MSRLLVTRKLFEALMFHFQVLPQFWEYVLLFGVKSGENEMSPPQLRFRRLAADKTERRTQCSAGFGTKLYTIVFASTPSLIDTECAYGLRYAELNNREGNNPWSIRQTAIYHKYTAADKSSGWIMIAASERTRSSLDLYVKSCTDLASFNPFEIHVLVLDSALANWRSYIIDLTERINCQVRRPALLRLNSFLLISRSRTKCLSHLLMGEIRFSFLMYKSIPPPLLQSLNSKFQSWKCAEVDHNLGRGASATKRI